MSTRTVALSMGATAELVGFDGRALALVSPVAFAPGSPVRFTVTLDDGIARPIEGRSMGSRRRPAGDFDVRLRPVNMRRTVREALLTVFQDS